MYLVGSHNYNLNDELSDKDYKVMVWPTFEDLYNGKMFSSGEHGVDKGVEYSAHDVRKLGALLWKANLNFIEVLFSRETEFYCELPYTLKSRANELAKMNLPYLYNASVGTYFEKRKRIDEGKATEKTRPLLERFGYDTKEALHAFRMLDFLERYARNDFSDFASAMWYEGVDRDELMHIKRGRYTLDSMRTMLDEKLSEAQWRLASIYRSREPNTLLGCWLDKIVMQEVRRHVAQQGGDAT